jgi:hypothetical protein
LASLEAKLLLDEDIEEGKHLEVDPQELYESRAEYQQFSLVTFCGHLYQEVKRWEKNMSKVHFGRKQKLQTPTKEVNLGLLEMIDEHEKRPAKKKKKQDPETVEQKKQKMAEIAALPVALQATVSRKK